MKEVLIRASTQCAILCMVAAVALLSISRAGADIAISTIAALFLLHQFLRPEKTHIKTAEVALLLALAMWMVVATTIQTGWTRDTAVAAAWVRFVLLYLAIRYWLMDAIFASADTVRRLAVTAWIVLLLVMMDTYCQYVTGTSLSGNPMAGERLTGPLSAPNIGAYFVHLLFPVLGLMLREWEQNGQVQRTVMGLVSAACVIALIPLTGERSSTMSLLAGLVVFGVLLFLYQPNWRRYLFWSGALLLLAAAFVSTQPIVQKRTDDLKTHVGDFWQTPYGQLFQGGWLAWKEHPVTGIGIRQYPNACETLLASDRVTYCDMHPHQMYIQWLAETGIVGFSLFIGWIGLLFRHVWQMRKHADPVYFAAGTAGVMVALFPFVTSQSNVSNWPAGLMWFSLALSVALLSRRAHD